MNAVLLSQMLNLSLKAIHLKRGTHELQQQMTQGVCGQDAGAGMMLCGLETRSSQRMCVSDHNTLPDTHNKQQEKHIANVKEISVAEGQKILLTCSKKNAKKRPQIETKQD